jgi:hypothetical protein
VTHKTVRSATCFSPVIRGAYFYLHEKRTKDGTGAPIPEENQKYEFVGLIPKLDRDAAKCANYMQFCNMAMGLVPQVPEWNGAYPANGNWPIKDGDAKAAKYPWMAGNWVVNFSGNFAPKVALMQNGQPVEIPARRIGSTEAYKSGDYLIASMYAFTYDNKSRGVKFDMEGVLFVGPGDPIGTAQRSAAQIFDGVAVPAGAVPMTAPAAPAMPTPPGMPQSPQYSPPMAPAVQGYAQPGPTSGQAPGMPQPPQYTAPAAPAAPGPLPPMPGR